jgi:hypothetical protein
MRNLIAIFLFVASRLPTAAWPRYVPMSTCPRSAAASLDTPNKVDMRSSAELVECTSSNASTSA